MDSGDAWFADTSVNGTTFKFFMDTGASKSVMSSKRFMSIPEMFRPQLYNTRMKFQVGNGEVLSSMGVAHVSIQMHGYTFKLPIFVCDLGDIDCIFGLDAGKEAGFISCTRTAGYGSMQTNTMNLNNCLGVVAMLCAIFEQFSELNLNPTWLQLSK